IVTFTSQRLLFTLFFLCDLYLRYFHSFPTRRSSDLIKCGDLQPNIIHFGTTRYLPKQFIEAYRLRCNVQIATNAPHLRITFKKLVNTDEWRRCSWFVRVSQPCHTFSDSFERGHFFSFAA